MNRNIPVWASVSLGVIVVFGGYKFVQKTVVPPQAKVVVQQPFDHDDFFELPPFGEASSLFSYPVTAMQDHCCNLALSHGLPRTAAAVRGGRTLCSQSGRAT